MMDLVRRSRFGSKTVKQLMRSNSEVRLLGAEVLPEQEQIRLPVAELTLMQSGRLGGK